jgi:hypothetical protein
LRGDYDSVDVNSKNYMDTSEGTDAFMAEFERHLYSAIAALQLERLSSPPSMSHRQ